MILKDIAMPGPVEIIEENFGALLIIGIIIAAAVIGLVLVKKSKKKKIDYTKLEEMKRKYAYTLARVGLNVQPNQTVLVEAGIEGADFVPVFAEECYKLGAGNVVVNYLDYPNLKAKAQYRSFEEVAKVEETEQAYYQKFLDEGACYIRLETVNPLLMADVTEAQSNAIFAHVDGTRNVMRKASREKHCQWLIAMIPTKQWADYIMPESDDKLADLWNLLFKLCYIDETNDVVETWEKKNERRGEIEAKLDALNLRELHYTAGNGTDLYVGLNPYSKYSHAQMPGDAVKFNPNMPTEEVATSPEKYGTHGVVYSTKPLVLGGKTVENFGFRFENGKVVEVLAKEGKEMLEALVASDENAGYLGEAALVEYHSPISMSNIVYYTTLIDENASCHLALGRSLGAKAPEGSGYTFNDSKIHIDFMIGSSDLSIIGKNDQGEEIVIFKDGDFAI